jgi:chemotaxis protein CheX
VTVARCAGQGKIQYAAKALLDMAENVVEGERPVSAEIRERLVEPFITAMHTALGEMATTEVAVRVVCQTSSLPVSSNISVAIRLTSANEAWLVLSFPERTAAILSSRILTGVTANVDHQLLVDCVSEIGNVVAGQAKALLAGTPFHFAFSLPRVIAGDDDFGHLAGRNCVVVSFDCDAGDFALRLYS